MKKRIFAGLLALCLTLALLPGTAAAATVVASGECGKQGDNLSWTSDDSGTLTISGTGEMQDYSQVEERPWSANSASINNIILDNDVTSIGDNAFGGCMSLASVNPH